MSVTVRVYCGTLLNGWIVIYNSEIEPKRMQIEITSWYYRRLFFMPIFHSWKHLVTEWEWVGTESLASAIKKTNIDRIDKISNNIK